MNFTSLFNSLFASQALSTLKTSMRPMRGVSIQWDKKAPAVPMFGRFVHSVDAELGNGSGLLEFVCQSPNGQLHHFLVSAADIENVELNKESAKLTFSGFPTVLVRGKFS